MKGKRGKKQQILLAAGRLFRQKGYDSTTVEDIAKEVGLLKGSIYFYFENKEDILAQIIQEPVEECLRRITEIRDSNIKWDEKIAEAIKTHLNVWHAYYGTVFTALSAFYVDVNSEVGECIVSMFDEYKAIISDIIRQGIEAHEIDSDLDPTILFYSLLGMCSWMYKWYTPDGRLPVEEIAKQFAKIYLEGTKSNTSTIKLPANPQRKRTT